MAQITVRTNGQTLTVNASVSHWTTAALALVASAGDDVESTTTTTIRSDYTMHFANTATTATITVKQADGTTIHTGTYEVNPGVGARVLSPAPDAYQLAADVVSTRDLAAGEASYPRTEVVSSAVTCTSQRLLLSYFRATKPELVATMRWLTGGTAAAATPTLVRAGIYTVSSAGAITLVASTANDTALMATQNAAVSKALSTPYQLVAGEWYAYGLLVVSGTTVPTVYGKILEGGLASEAGLAPKLCGYIGSQADLPAGPVAAGSIADGNSNPYIVGVAA